MNKNTYTPGHGDRATSFMARRRIETHAWFALPHLRPGMSVLDCGCGPGTLTLGLAKAVAPGQVTGVDIGVGQIKVARESARQAGTANVHFAVADAANLPFDDGSFDLVFSHALVEHLPDQLAGLREMRRVLKPGGMAAVCSPDWGGFIVAPPKDGITEAINLYMHIQTTVGGDVYAGRRIGSLMTDAGFSDVQMSARYECYEDVASIAEYLAERLDAPDAAGIAEAGGFARPDVLAAHLRSLPTLPGALFAQAWVAATGKA